MGRGSGPVPDALGWPYGGFLPRQCMPRPLSPPTGRPCSGLQGRCCLPPPEACGWGFSICSLPIGDFFEKL